MKKIFIILIGCSFLAGTTTIANAQDNLLASNQKKPSLTSDLKKEDVSSTASKSIILNPKVEKRIKKYYPTITIM